MKLKSTTNDTRRLFVLYAACFFLAVPARAQEEEIARADSLSASAEEMSGAGNHAEAVRLETEAMEIHEKAEGKESDEYATTCYNLALFNGYSGKIPNPSVSAEKPWRFMKMKDGKVNISYISTLNNITESYNRMGNYTEAPDHV